MNLKTSCTPKVCVLLATYNGILFLEEQVRSILWQQGVETCIYVRDDGSTDGTQELLEDISKKNNRVIVVDKFGEPTNSPALNFFKLVSLVDVDAHDYVSFSDQDDIWSPSKLVNAIALISRADSAGYSSNLTTFSEYGHSLGFLKKDHPQRTFDHCFQGASAGCTYVVNSKVLNEFKSRCLNNFEDFPARLSHDWIIYYFCRASGYKWVFDNRSFIFYRQHANNSYGSLLGFSGVRKKLKAAFSPWYRSHIVYLGRFAPEGSQSYVLVNKLRDLKLNDRIYLLLRIGSFRRSLRDRIVLFILILLWRNNQVTKLVNSSSPNILV